VKEIAADANALCLADLAAGGQIEPLVGPDSDFGEAFLALTDLLPHGKRELGVLAGKLAGTPMAVCNPDGSQLLGVLDRNGAQADGVDELKDGGIGTDTESEGEDGDEGETGTETKKPESMAKVAPKRCHSIPLGVSDDRRGRMSRGLSTENSHPAAVMPERRSGRDQSNCSRVTGKLEVIPNQKARPSSSANGPSTV
jgi:hypothetical protein